MGRIEFGYHKITIKCHYFEAINATTVEVTFENAIDDVNALKFTIDGLEVKNAVVKQTDSKTAVLTTAAQEADKTYKVSVDGEEIGSFKGISAVIPTAIKVTTPSVQGTIGQQATVSAEVTVPEGQSKAGIPVTFNIVNENSNLNEKIEVVAYTNDSGVASYSYTRYYKHNDNVAAYATQKSTVVAYGKVFWAETLTIKEVTEGNVLTNGNKKIYEISSPEHANGFVNVTFKENVQVTPDKLVSSVTITDAPVYVKNANGTLSLASNKYPYEVTTGGVQLAIVKLNAAGKATFTLEGANATVTPVVFVDGTESYSTTTGLTTWTGDGKLNAQELQATAPSVKFELNHTLGLKVEAQGVQNAAAQTAKGNGGREFLVTLTDAKTGKVAPAGSTVQVVFPKGSISKDKAVYFENKDGSFTQVQEGTIYNFAITGAKGQTSFKLVGAKDAFATPTVYVENDKVAGLSDGDLRQIAETTYFVDAVINKSALETYSSIDLTEETTTIGNGENAIFKYASVDQNGFPYYAANGDYEVTYQVSPQFADVYVSGNGLATKLIKKGTTESVKVKAINGVATLTVQAAETVLSSSVTVSASSSQITLEDLPATVTFSKYSSTVVTDIATNVNTTADELEIKGALYSYKGANYQFNGSTITLAKFEEYIQGNDAVVSVTVDENGKLTFNVVDSAPSTAGSWEAARVAINNAISEAAVKSQLAKLPDFSKLIKADQDAIAGSIWTSVSTGTPVAATAAEFKTNYESTLVDPLKTAESVEKLQAAITAAQAKHDKATEGTSVGQYATGAKAAFQAKIDVAKTALNGVVNGTTVTSGTNHTGTLDGAKTTLETTDTNAFEATKVTDARVELGKSITQAKALVAAAQEGTAPGEYAIGSVATLQALITTAEGHYSAAYTSNATLAAQKTLVDNGITAFNAKKVVVVTVDADTTGLVLTFSPALAAAISATNAVTTVVDTAGSGTATVAVASSTAGGVTISLTTAGAIKDGDTITVEAKVNNVLDTSGAQAVSLLTLKYDLANTKWVLVPSTNFVAK